LSRTGGARAACEQPHAVVIDGTSVALTLRRSARRSFALQVDHRGARVAVPLRTSLAEVDRFVLDHGRWLLDRLRARARTPQSPVFEAADGARLPLFGCELRLRVAACRAPQWRLADDGGEELVLPAAGELQRALLRTLQARALGWYRERVEAYCGRLGLAPPPVRLSNARTRWGSCSRASGIRLHWRLVHLPPALIDYVVAHEVAHLLEMNHSPRFWAVVERLYPGWRAARRELRAAAAGLPLLGAPRAAADASFTPQQED
jgi:predicted metal-dependent hydrolase